jgi:predicted DNA-binding transcriptional regulator AlpA
MKHVAEQAADTAYERRRASPWLTLPETAEYLRVSMASLYRAMARPDGPPVRLVGARRVVNVGELERWALRQPLAKGAGR